jgi:alkanesulfonate monooxygenase SsuD/methylene tetrahydromethanopterin reductase-like flavin-dependent oxidoreductase (luciferase family)
VKIAAVLSPVSSWDAVVEAGRVADAAGLHAIGLWDHYHSPRPEWGYVAGWTAYGALAAATARVRLVPMVLNNLHYDLGVLAKESSTAALASAGRFELAIGAGDWPDSFRAWGKPYPSRAERLGRVRETIIALRLLWAGEPVSFDGDWLHLSEATCTPAPAEAPRVIVGAGASREALRELAALADEINVYADPGIVGAALERAANAERRPPVSIFLSWEWEKWPDDPSEHLRRWAESRVDRAYISLGADDMPRRIEALAEMARTLTPGDAA